MLVNKEQREALINYLDRTSHPELVNSYLFFLESKHHLQPVLFPREKKVYQSAEELIKLLEAEGKLWKETEIKVGFSQSAVNDQTKKIYICPFTGKVFGDNTHPSPQDAIYDWVSKCPENKERIGGLPAKRFYISEDPEVIKSYMAKNKPVKEAVTKIVYSSAMNGKLFNSKEAIIDDFKRHYIKRMDLLDVQNQDKFEIEDHFLSFLQEQLAEEKITQFVEALAEHEEFVPYIESWLESADD